MVIDTIGELSMQAHKLPISVLMDIDKRVTDWIASGGKYTDPYIKQQCKYAENVINKLEVV